MRAGQMIVVEKKEGDSDIARIIPLPLEEPARYLHVSFTFRAVDLMAGAEKWQDGRLFVDWVDGAGRTMAYDGIMSCRELDKKTRSADLLIGGRVNGLVPVLRVEHLGRSGRMEIHSLRVVAVRERGWGLWAGGALVVLWGAWLYWFVRLCSHATKARVALAAVFLLLVGWFLIVPGPWANVRPLAGQFDFGKALAETAEISANLQNWDVASPRGETAVQGSIFLQVKMLLWFLRPVLHALMFAMPAFCMVALCGERSAWWAGLLVSLGVELAQVAFGFSFDWIDVTDLALDWIGIALGILIWRVMLREWKGRFSPWRIRAKLTTRTTLDA